MIAVFKNTLAEIKDQGHRIHIKRLWRSIEVPKEDVLGFAPSRLEGAGVLRLRRFVLPWNRIFYVTDWSKCGVAVAASEKESTAHVGATQTFAKEREYLMSKGIGPIQWVIVPLPC